tara:strand:- start:300 stop:719 length:420 start_codon:yes stop_codon:yes gene_type:complete
MKKLLHISESDLKKIQLDWGAVRTIEKGLTPRQWCIPGGSVINEGGAPDESFNLPFFLAYAVLDKYLEKRLCPGKRVFLGTKMDWSRPLLDWLDYGSVNTGKESRNGIAHRAILLSKEDCQMYINAIEDELRHWGAINA